MGNKSAHFDYLGHPVPLLWGEFSKQDSYVSKGGPLGVGGLLSVRPVAVKQDGKQRGVWSTLAMEEGTCWYVGEETGWCTLGWIQV